MMEEETLKRMAKAVEQVAKTSEIALDSGRALAKFLYDLVGESLVELGQAGTDRIKAWRLRNLIRTAAEARSEIDARALGERVRSLPAGEAIRWIEGAAQEEEPEIQTLWAQLLANAVDPETAAPVSKTIVGILRELRPLDARVLEYLDTQGWDVFAEVSGGFNVKRLAEALRVDDRAAWVAIANLWRLGCLLQQVASLRAIDGQGIRTVGAAHDELTAFRPSPLGTELLVAVRRKAAKAE